MPTTRKPAWRRHPVSAALTAVTALLAAAFLVSPATAASGGVSITDFSQCSNGAPPSVDTGCGSWINGALQKSNSHYAEDQVVPQRLVVQVASAGTHTVVLSWQDRKGSSNSHAYDSLATWNYTQTTADRCLGVSKCPTGTASTTDIPLDPTNVGPCAGPGCSTKTADHQLPGQVLTMYGGQLKPVAATDYSHSSAGSLGSDDYTTLTITYTTAAAGPVQLLWGGHLAATSGPRGWGTPYGSGNISGGPYHFKLMSLDGASAGSRDNQIQAAAILGPPVFTVTKTASPTTAVPGQSVTYTVTVSNTGNSAGSTTFVESNDSRVGTVTAGTTTPSGGTCTPVAGTKDLSCTTSSIDPGKSQVFPITVTMPASFTTAPGGGGCSATQYPVTDTVTLANNQTAQATVCVTAAPAFTITKTADKSVASTGEVVTYTITVTNTGKASGATTFLEDNDPSVTNVTFVGSSPSGGTCAAVSGTTDLSCTTTTLAPNDAQAFTVTAKMPATFSGTPAAGCAAGQYPVVDTVTLKSGATASAKVCVTATPAFTITKTANPTTASPGQLVTYTITVTNSGSAPGSTGFVEDNATNVTSPTFVSASGSGGSCTAVSGTTDFTCGTGSLAPGASQVFTFTVKMPASFTGTPATGCATSGQYPVVDRATLTGGASASATVCVNTAPAFTVTKSASTTTATPGQLVTYTITVTNGGSSPGATAFLEDNAANVTSPAFAGSSPTGGTCTPKAGTTDFDCQTSTLDPGKSQVFTFTVKMPASFTGSPAPGCAAGQYPVLDTVTLANGQTASAKVCVTAAPAFDVTKTVDKATALPGEKVTYTITVTNNGTAPGATAFPDDNDPNVTNVTFTGSTPSGGTCTPVGTTTDLSCQTSTLDPGASQAFTVTANLPTTFSGTSGTGGCKTGEHPVTDTVTIGSKTASATVCVTAKPNLTLTKSADVTTVKNGDQVVYTIAYANDGSAAANGTTVTETVPTGTQYLGCTGGCTPTGSPASTVTWSLGAVPAKSGGTLTMTVKVTSFTACTITNTARVSSPDVNGGAPVPSNTVTVTVTPTPDLAAAKATGSAVGASVATSALSLVTLPTPSISTAQTGVGSSTARNELLGIPGSLTGGLLTADVLDTSSTSAVTATPAQAADTSAAKAAGVCVLPTVTGGCRVEATVVLGVAGTIATGTGASASSAGSTFKDLKVDGVSYSNVKPNTTIDLGGLVKVVLDEEVASVTGPSAGQTSGGLWAADLTVTMIHVTGPLGLDVSVAKAVSHAEFPQLTVCGAPTTGRVGANALIASASTNPSVVPVVVGYVEIPPTGSTGVTQQVATLGLPGDGSVVSGSASRTTASGSLTPSPSASSLAEVTDLCVLPAASRVTSSNPKGCLVRGDLVRSQATSSPTGSSDAGTQLLNVVVDGVPPIAGTPPPNTTVLLPGGLGSVVLNEHVCTSGAAYDPLAPVSCLGTTGSGLTVTAVHVVLVVGSLAGAEVKVAQAHTEAFQG